MNLAFYWLRAARRRGGAWLAIAWSMILLPFVGWAYVLWFVQGADMPRWALWASVLAGTLVLLRAYVPVPRRVRQAFARRAEAAGARMRRGKDRAPRHGRAEGTRKRGATSQLPDPGFPPQDPMLDPYDAASRTGRWK